MKYPILLFLLILALPGVAQEYKQKVNADQLIKIQYHQADMRIEGYKGNEVVIQATNYNAPPERAKGLRSLYNTAVDNTNIGMAVESKDGALVIREATKDPGNYVIKVPEGSRLSIEEMNWGGSGVVVSGMKNELEVKSLDADVRLNEVTGPVIVNTTSGEIIVKFSEYSQKGPSMISSIGSDIDVTLPANSKADLALSSVAGEIFTDLDLQIQNKNGKEASLTYVGGGNSTIRATLGGGGAPMTIKNIGSNIYIRKK